ncbi:MAG: hypothetical protein QOC59_1990 [Microbacteriaceae bacterium]|nr:hypothetical protein [Microbacteriaceae bacterium]
MIATWPKPLSTEAPVPSTDPSVQTRPAGVAAVRRPGRSPYAVLMFGGGVLTGWGLRTHDFGLPGAVADALTAESGRGVDITVVVDPDPTAARAREGLHGLRLRRFDAVIIVLGERAALSNVTPSGWASGLQGLAALLASECAEGAPAFIYDSARAVLSVASGVSRKVTAAAAQHVDLGERIAAGSTLVFRELPPPPRAAGLEHRFSSVTYEDWADLIIQRLHVGLKESEARDSPGSARSFRERPDDEDLRQRALRSAGIRDGERVEILEYIVRQAKATFGVAGAALNIVGSDLQWPKATIGLPAATVGRDVGFCDITIQADGLTLIYDTHRDPRVVDNPLTEGPHGLRFYAGYPIHTWDGYRIGALCIYDVNPRYMRETELLTLRAFAGRIEQELWSAALRQAA